MKKKITVSRLFLVMISMMPIIDTANGILLRDENTLINIGQIYRLSILAIAVILSKYMRLKETAICYGLFLLFCAIQVVDNVSYGLSSMMICIKLFLPIIMIFVMKTLYKKRIILPKDILQVIECISIITPITIIIPYILRIGYRTYESAGYLGFYYATNEISFVLSSCVLFSLHRLSHKINTKYTAILGINILAIMLVGTKSGLAVIAIGILLLFLNMMLSGEYIAKKIVLLMAVLILIVIGLIAFKKNIQEVVERWAYGYYNHANGSALFFLSSGRTWRLMMAWEEFHQYSLFHILFGCGLAGANHGFPYVEMDFHDMVFSTGWVGTTVMFLIYVYLCKDIKWTYWKTIMMVTYLILIIGGGHVLYAGLGGMMLAVNLVYLITSNMSDAVWTLVKCPTVTEIQQ